jgi:hypothetical protein
LHRTRRRWWPAIGGLSLYLLGIVTTALPYLRTANWPLLIPQGVQVALWPRALEIVPALFSQINDGSLSKSARADLAESCRRALRESTDYAVRGNAFSLLMFLKKDAAVAEPEMLAILKDSSFQDHDIAISIVTAAEVRSPAMIEQLMAMARSSPVRRDVVDALERALGTSPQAVPFLADLLSGPNAPDAARALASRGRAGAEALAQAIAGPDSRACDAALRSVEQFGPDHGPVVLAAMIRVFSTPHHPSWTEARNALEDMGPWADGPIGESFLTADQEVFDRFVSLMQRRTPSGQGCIPFLRQYAQDVSRPLPARSRAAAAHNYLIQWHRTTDSILDLSMFTPPGSPAADPAR